jgi:hypothetical protein
MDTFFKNLKSINDDMIKLKGSYIINNKIKHKQLLLYYMYRIICKHSNIMKLNTNPSVYEDVFTSIGIPSDMTDKCYPLCEKISNIDEDLNEMIDKGIFLFESASENITQNEILGKKEQIEDFNDFINSKKTKELIKEDLTLLALLIPRLSKYKLRPSYRV